jgi:hypothetical protein
MIGNFSTVVWIKVPLQTENANHFFVNGLLLHVCGGMTTVTKVVLVRICLQGDMLWHCCKNPFVFLAVVVLKP